jgi:hypothetical protein
MITDRQLHLVRGLASEMRWTGEQLANWLRRTFEVDSPEALGTTRRGAEAIQRLLAIKQSKKTGNRGQGSGNSVAPASRR